MKPHRFRQLANAVAAVLNRHYDRKAVILRTLLFGLAACILTLAPIAKQTEASAQPHVAASECIPGHHKQATMRDAVCCAVSCAAIGTMPGFEHPAHAALPPALADRQSELRGIEPDVATPPPRLPH